MTPYAKARHYPPMDNKAYKQAVCAEMLALEFHLQAEALYEAASAQGLDLYGNYGYYHKHPKELVTLIKEHTRASS